MKVTDEFAESYSVPGVMLTLLTSLIVIMWCVNTPVYSTTIEVGGKPQLIAYSERAGWVVPVEKSVFGLLVKTSDAPLFGGRIYLIDGELKRQECWVGPVMGGSAGCAFIPASLGEREMWEKSPLAKR